MTEEAEPDEDLVYADAAPVVVEWRRARDEFHKALKTGTALDRTEVQERMLELEVAIVEEHGLTLPPATFPWDEFDRRDQLWERQQDLMRVRVKRNRALLRRWLRRVLTFRTVAGTRRGALPAKWKLSRSEQFGRRGSISPSNPFTSLVRSGDN